MQRRHIGVKINQEGKPSLKPHQNSSLFFFLIVAYYCLMSFSLFKFLFSLSFTKAILLIQENQKIRSVQKYVKKLRKEPCTHSLCLGQMWHIFPDLSLQTFIWMYFPSFFLFHSLTLGFLFQQKQDYAVLSVL